jgi:hypothetical protein
VLLLPRYFSTQFTLKQKHLSCRAAIFFWSLLIPVRFHCYQPCHRYVSPVISRHHQSLTPVTSHHVTGACPLLSAIITSPCLLLSAIMSPVRVPCYQSSCHQSVSPVISHNVTGPCSLLSAIMPSVRVPVISHHVPSYQPCHQSVSPVISHVTSPCLPLSAMSPVRVPCYQPCHNCSTSLSPFNLRPP